MLSVVDLTILFLIENFRPPISNPNIEIPNPVFDNLRKMYLNGGKIFIRNSYTLKFCGIICKVPGIRKNGKIGGKIVIAKGGGIYV